MISCPESANYPDFTPSGRDIVKKSLPLVRFNKTLPTQMVQEEKTW